MKITSKSSITEVTDYIFTFENKKKFLKGIKMSEIQFQKEVIFSYMNAFSSDNPKSIGCKCFGLRRIHGIVFEADDVYNLDTEYTAHDPDNNLKITFRVRRNYRENK